MRILYLHQFFKTRAAAGGTRSYEFARRLVEAGHEVTIVTAAAGDGSSAATGPATDDSTDPGTGPSAPHGGLLASARVVDGIRVVEARGGHGDYMAATSVGYGRRLGAFGRFALAATAAAVRGPRPDVVLASSPPLTLAVPGAIAARRWSAPLVFEVRDLWPEAPIQMGALGNPIARALARALEAWTYRRASELVALSPGMRDGMIAAGADPRHVALIPNAADLDLFAPDNDPGDLRERIGATDGEFVCAYFGTLGEANDLTQVVEAAALLQRRGERGVRFALQGEGKRRPAIERAVRERGLDNVVLLPASDKRSAARLAAASDACLTVFKDVPILATNSPNKLFDTFAAGRAAIVNTDGWQRELVESNAAGLFARPGDPADLADQVVRLRDDRELARELGANGRRLAEREFDRDLLADRLRGVLERAVREHGGATR